MTAYAGIRVVGARAAVIKQAELRRNVGDIDVGPLRGSLAALVLALLAEVLVRVRLPARDTTPLVSPRFGVPHLTSAAYHLLCALTLKHVDAREAVERGAGPTYGRLGPRGLVERASRGRAE